MRRAESIALESQPKLLHRSFFQQLFPLEKDFSYWRISSESLIELICRMTSASNAKNLINPASGDVPAGLTYLGQMLAHDIVPNTHEPDARHVSPFLNLDSLYPSVLGTKESNAVLDAMGKFRLCERLSHDSAHTVWDYCRLQRSDNPDAIAKIVDPRNDQNIILAQIVIVWKQLHNKTVDYLTDKGVGIAEAFNFAREFVVRLFQKCVVDEFLSRVLDKHVFDYYFQNRPLNEISIFDFDDREACEPIRPSFQIPNEFSQAAFRFGHSMARQNYTVNKDERLEINQLFQKHRKAKYFVNLERFFDGRDNEGQREIAEVSASFINLQMAYGLTQMDGPLSDRQTHAKSDSQEHEHDFERRLENCLNSYLCDNDPEKDALLRKKFFNILGIDLRASEALPTGGEILDAICANSALKKRFEIDLKVDFSQYDNLIRGHQVFKVKVADEKSDNSEMDLSNIPLYLFILLEAEHYRQYFRESKSTQERLGPIGSVIIAEVLRQSISRSEESYFDLDLQLLEASPHPLKDYYKQFFGESTKINFLDLKNVTL